MWIGALALGWAAVAHWRRAGAFDEKPWLCEGFLGTGAI